MENEKKANDVFLEVRSLSKKYGNFYALNDVSMAFKRGEVHALVGENGAGKSTLVKCICGAEKPESGSILIGGAECHIGSPFDAFEAGIATMYQEFNLLPDMTISQNLFVGREITGAFGRLKKKKMLDESQRLLHEIELDASPQTLVKDLPPAQKQMLEITKGIAFNSNLIFMDEPSAILTETEVAALFEVIRKLTAAGVAVVYISHRMEEIFQIADTVSVLKDGKHIITAPISDFKDKDEIIRHMIGREMDANYFAVDKTRVVDRDTEVLRVEHLKNDKVNDVSFSLYKGEILGLSGLVGSGRTEIVSAIFGADPLESGDIYINGEKVSIKSPGDAIRHGLSFVPEERALQGVILSQSIRENNSIVIQEQIFKNGFINRKLQTEIVEEYVQKLQVKLPGIEVFAKSLSGGNQQKSIIAKWLATHSDILIMDEPTRGIDVGAKSEIYKILSEIASEGVSIIVVSSEMPEIMNICDRILVISNHQVANELMREEVTEEKIMASAISNV